MVGGLVPERYRDNRNGAELGGTGRKDTGPAEDRLRGTTRNGAEPGGKIAIVW